MEVSVSEPCRDILRVIVLQQQQVDPNIMLDGGVNMKQPPFVLPHTILLIIIMMMIVPNHSFVSTMAIVCQNCLQQQQQPQLVLPIAMMVVSMTMMRQYHMMMIIIVNVMNHNGPVNLVNYLS